MHIYIYISLFFFKRKKNPVGQIYFCILVAFFFQPPECYIAETSTDWLNLPFNSLEECLLNRGEEEKEIDR